MRKMLKHDLKAIWPVWRIVAPVVFVLSALAGAMVGLGYAEYKFFEPVNGLFMLSAYLIESYWPIILSAFSMLITVLIVVRYYKNFFTDEGYLTFTLPVSRTSLLNSKILMALIWLAATAAVCLLSNFAYSFMVELIMPEDAFSFGSLTAEFMEDVIRSIFAAEERLHIFFFLIELLFMGIAWTVASLLLLFLCITIGAVIVKRAKLVLGLGIYYGANAVIVITIYIGIIIGIVALSAASEISDAAILVMLHVIFSMSGVLFSALGVGAYLLNQKLINEKLNLP